MSGLGGLNKSPNGVVIGLVQLQLPDVATPEQLQAQTRKVCELVGKARRQSPVMDLVVFPEYCLHGLSMNIDPAIASSVFVTTITDVIGFVSFLGVGAYFL